MIEIQCTSCHTRYRIDERVLPDETPTFKCSRCGHVFNAEPVAPRVRRPAPSRPVDRPKPPRPQPAHEPDPQPELPKASAPEPAPGPSPQPEASPGPEFTAQPENPPPPEPAARAEAAPQAEQPARATEPPPTEEENPLDRIFSRERPSDVETGENLTFDFASEPKPGEHQAEEASDDGASHSDDHWEVGDQADEHMIAREEPSHRPLDEPAEGPSPAPKPTRTSQRQTEMPPIKEFHAPEFTALDDDDDDDEERPRRKSGSAPEIPDEVAYFAAQRTTHSSAWFIGLFVVIAILFGGVSLAVHVQPAAAVRLLSQAPRVGQNFQPPTLPAMLVALHDVHSDYQKVKGGQTALVISGTAENLGGAPLHAVLLAVDLLDDAGKQMASGATYCGTGLSANMIGEMTPREIEFLQRLDPQKNFAVQPSKTAPFLLVFIDPPRRVADLRIQVTKAVAVQGKPAPRS